LNRFEFVESNLREHLRQKASGVSAVAVGAAAATEEEEEEEVGKEWTGRRIA
jgi:hypothetical protein